jgi:hypothetical protein
MKHFFLLFILLSSQSLLVAQEIGAIKKEAQKAKEQRDSKSGNQKAPERQGNQNNQNYDSHHYDSGLGGSLDACFNCFGGIATLTSLIFTSNANFNKKQLENQIYRNKSLELDLKLGVDPINPTLFSGRVAYHTGAFSFDYRRNLIFEKTFRGNTDYLSTVDFRFLQFNLVNKKSFNFRVGTGLFIDPIKEYWPEYSGSVDIYFMENFQLGIEYIYAGNSGIKALEEFNMKLAYSIINKPNKRVDIVAFGMNQLYYNTIRLNTFGIGINYRPQFGSF